MKKNIYLLILLCIFFGNPGKAQINRLMNKVTKSVADKIDGKPAESTKNTNKEPEPKCACDKPELVVDLGKLKLMYSELSILLNDEGAILLSQRYSKDYYISKDGVTQGPFKYGDPRLAGFDVPDNSMAPDNRGSDEGKAAIDPWANNQYISKTGEKYLIKFNGKSYGPYATIQQFKVNKSKDKFASIVVQTIAISNADAKKMEKEIDNAKTDQEKLDIQMKYNQQMMNNMMEGGGPNSTLPKLVTNVEGATYDVLKSQGGILNSDIKYDDILFKSYDKVVDLSNNVLFDLKQDAQNSASLFINTTNSLYAWYNSGTLSFSDSKVMSDLFNPHLVKVNTLVNLAYMYYSPKSSAIMQCKIPF
jgi:hypothetical protein